MKIASMAVILMAARLGDGEYISCVSRFRSRQSVSRMSKESVSSGAAWAGSVPNVKTSRAVSQKRY